MTHKINVYKIFWGGVNEDKYVGSTKSNLSQRMGQHRSCAGNIKNVSLLYDAIRSCIYKFSYVLLESYQVTCKDEQLKWEQHWIGKLDPNLNKIKAYATPEQHVERNKKYTKERANKNKKNIIRTSARCFCGGRYNMKLKQNRETHKATKKHQKYIKHVTNGIINLKPVK